MDLEYGEIAKKPKLSKAVCGVCDIADICGYQYLVVRLKIFIHIHQ